MRLAQNLENEINTWQVINPPQTEAERPAEFLEFRRRGEILWINDIEAGIVLFELCGLGGLDDQPRIKNLVLQIRAECLDSMNAFKVPAPHMVTHMSLGMVRSTLDVYFVKMFEKLCHIWPKSFDDEIKGGNYGSQLKHIAGLHAKVMKELSDFLKSRHAKDKT